MNITSWGKAAVICLGILGSLLAGGCKQDKAPDAAAKAPPPEVGVVTIQPGSITLTTELTGRVAPQMVAEVRPQVGGIIKRRLFTEGTQVKAGAVLYQIDPATYEAAVASTKAALAKAEANAQTLRKKAERYKQLVAINAVSKQDYDDAISAQGQAEADIATCKAALDTAQINLAYTRITAPIDGVIGRSTVTQGALVTANQATALATIQQLDPVFIDVTQSSAEMLRLKRRLATGEIKSSGPGQAQVQVVLEDGTSYPQSGLLKFSEVSVDQATGSVTLRVQVPNPDQLLLPGMFIRAVIQEGIREQAMFVPQRGVSRNTAGKATVMVVGDNDIAEQRIITAGRAVGDAWLVSDGLKAGERVIVEGIQRVRPGSPVKPVPFTGKPADAGNPPAKQQ